MLIRDHINLMFRNPLIGAVETGDVRFPDMSEPYDAELADLARAVAAEQGTLLREGVYAGLLGPAYETPAEVRMLGVLGADAVGMSTVPEVIVARALGMRVLGVSCITNLACGLSNTPITHAEVLETTAHAAGRFKRLVRGVIARLQRATRLPVAATRRRRQRAHARLEIVERLRVRRQRPDDRRIDLGDLIARRLDAALPRAGGR